MTQVFLNYRTADEPFGAALLDQALSKEFGSSAVFFASKSIPLGADWEKEMFEAVRRSDALLAVMGRNWLNAEDDQGRRRIDDPDDFVRREILAALELGIQVVPIRLELPRRIPQEDLPAPLRPLAQLQGIEIRFRSTGPDIAKLARKLRQLVPALGAAAPEMPAPAAKFVGYAQHGGVLTQAESIRFEGDFFAGPKLG